MSLYYNSFVDESPATGAAAMFIVKETMKAAGATIPRSSDGSTFDNTGTDKITHAGAGANGMDNNRAWFVVRFVDGTEWCIQRNTTTHVAWRIKWSTSTGFSLGSYTATLVPNATDEQLMFGGGSDGSPTFATLFDADATYKIEVCVNSASPASFWMETHSNGTGIVSSSWFQDPLLDTHANDTSKFVVYVSKDPNCLLASRLSDNFYGLLAFMATTHSAANFLKVCAIGGYIITAGSTIVIPNGLGSNPFHGSTIDDSVPIVYGRYSALAAPTGYKGISSLFRWKGTTRANISTQTVSTSKDRIILGDLVTVWKGTDPAI